ncbi:hypothetical protein L202_07195 [Cryptococcus amylolentus CBS 6039]|uniref:NADP-dependent oxidoreductase domain-containing protein n=2 Tax=Cryptococcus amylolentus TaxID=104669 RepID=A0A1E3HEW4_9TREE|nr:hypothetical protein L202_07195 [Cryptococcus amylolentus CBS 6039]ODN74893.1 hypothetical protein L202_07195 [Cryptococcus amylolentus CBS 6039]ODO01786.1 hypothetical protein I350_06615 [Cryptococcus amylolentus CBS 6273]
MASIPTTTVAGKTVGRVGFGLMQLTWNPKPPSQEVSFAAMKAAVDGGSNLWSSASFYGNPGDNFANIKLIAAFFAKYPEYKDKIVLVVKGGVNYTNLHPIADIDYWRNEIKQMQEILGDKKLDVFSLARLPDAPVEEVFTNLKTLKDEGLFDGITPLAINEIEISLFSYDTPIRDAIAWHTKNKIPVFAYSPLGRGFITRTYKSPEDIPEGDFKRMLPRFQGKAFYENLKLVDKLDEIAGRKGVSGSQVALAWIVGLSEYTIPIPGSSNPTRIAQNIQSASISLSSAETKEINDFLDAFEVQGTRYPGAAMGQLMK